MVFNLFFKQNKTRYKNFISFFYQNYSLNVISNSFNLKKYSSLLQNAEYSFKVYFCNKNIRKCHGQPNFINLNIDSNIKSDTNTDTNNLNIENETNKKEINDINFDKILEKTKFNSLNNENTIEQRLTRSKSKKINLAKMHSNRNEIVVFAHLMNKDIENAHKVIFSTKYFECLSPSLLLTLIFESLKVNFPNDNALKMISRNYPNGNDIIKFANLLAWKFSKSCSNQEIVLKYRDFNAKETIEYLLKYYKYWDNVLPVHLEIFKNITDEFNINILQYFDSRVTKIENIPNIAKYLYLNKSKNNKIFTNNIPFNDYVIDEEFNFDSNSPSTYERFVNINIPSYLQKKKIDCNEEKQFNDMTQNWILQLTKCLENIYSNKNNNLSIGNIGNKNNNECGFELFFDKNECQRLAFMIIHNLLFDGLLSSYGTSVSTLIFRIGHMFARRFREKFSIYYGCTQFISNVTIEYYKQIENNKNNFIARELWMSIAIKKYGVMPCLPLIVSTNEIKLSTTDQIARFILNNFHDHYGKLAFNPIMRETNDQAQIIVFSANKQLENLYENVYCKKFQIQSHKLPRLTPVVPYIDFTLGNNISVRKGLVLNTLNKISRSKHNEKCINQSMAPTIDSVSALGSIAWTINNNHLDSIIKHIKNHKDYKSIDIISECSPITLKKALQFINTNYDLNNNSSFNQILKHATLYKQEKFKEYNDWLNFFKIISLCEHFKNKTFYIPHLIDFRGRAYPDCIFLNHYGSDIVRSMMVFKKKKKVGTRGLFWLKLHLFNQCGIDKNKTINERIEFIDKNIDNIVSCAIDPIQNTWWHQAKKKWQALATCYEIKSSLEDSNYESGFPIHQDGSCNGLQHFAALGRNPHGAKSVNLHPSDKPNDVYSDIAALVKERCKKVPQMAKLLQNGDVIDRDVVKTSVMTFVYGVTFLGAIKQVEKKLTSKNILTTQQIHLCSIYISREIFIALEILFGSAIKVMVF